MQIRGGDGNGSDIANERNNRIVDGVNPLVQAAPIVAAAVCRDGVVVLALHPFVAWGQKEEDESDTNQTNSTSPKRRLHDVPPEMGGPFRLALLNNKGSMVLLTAGWRADAMAWTERLRDIAKDELRLTGTLSDCVLASQASLLLATSESSQKVGHKKKKQYSCIDEQTVQPLTACRDSVSSCVSFNNRRVL